jgi:hypothetical protein
MLRSILLKTYLSEFLTENENYKKSAKKCQIDIKKKSN